MADLSSTRESYIKLKKARSAYAMGAPNMSSENTSQFTAQPACCTSYDLLPYHWLDMATSNNSSLPTIILLAMRCGHLGCLLPVFIA